MYRVYQLNLLYDHIDKLSHIEDLQVKKRKQEHSK